MKMLVIVDRLLLKYFLNYLQIFKWEFCHERKQLMCRNRDWENSLPHITLTLIPFSECEIGNPYRFPFILGMLFSPTLRMAKRVGLMVKVNVLDTLLNWILFPNHKKLSLILYINSTSKFVTVHCSVAKPKSEVRTDTDNELTCANLGHDMTRFSQSQDTASSFRKLLYCLRTCIFSMEHKRVSLGKCLTQAVYRVAVGVALQLFIRYWSAHPLAFWG